MTPNGEFKPEVTTEIREPVRVPQPTEKYQQIIQTFPKLSSSDKKDKIFGEHIDLKKLSTFTLKPQFT